MDGTLIDSGQLHETAWSLTLTHFGIPLERSLMRSLAGVPTFATIERLIEHFHLTLTASVSDINHFKEQAVHKLMKDYVKPTALIDVLHHFEGKKPMAVGTGAHTEEAIEVLTLCGIVHFFEAIIGADQVQAAKPAPDTFLKCAQILKAPPAACVVFEDAPLGIQAAKAAGMACIDVAKELNIHNDYFL